MRDESYPKIFSQSPNGCVDSFYLNSSQQIKIIILQQAQVNEFLCPQTPSGFPRVLDWFLKVFAMFGLLSLS